MSSLKGLCVAASPCSESGVQRVRFPHPNSKGKSGNKVTPQHSEMSKLLKGNQENSSTGLVADFEVWCKSLSAFP